MFQRPLSAVLGVVLQANQYMLRNCSLAVHGQFKLVSARSSACKPCDRMRMQTRCMATEKKQLALLDIDERGVATLRMNRPPVNGLNMELLDEMRSVLESIEKDKDVHGLILTSTLPKVFNAGLDIHELYPAPNLDRERLERYWTTFQDIMIQLYSSSLVTIAAINGHAPAGGCVLTLGCDYRIMAPNSSIGLSETLLGIVVPVWSIDMFMSVVGPREAERALQLGHMYSTEEAHRVGLVDRISDDVVAEANKEMDKWLKIPAPARQKTKDYVRQEIRERFIAEREQDIERFLGIVTSDAAQNTMGAYLANLSKKRSQ